MKDSQLKLLPTPPIHEVQGAAPKPGTSYSQFHVTLRTHLVVRQGPPREVSYDGKSAFLLTTCEVSVLKTPAKVKMYVGVGLPWATCSTLNQPL